MKKIIMLFCLGLLGCNSTYHGKDVCGADEFVTDSYKIRQGKFSILQLEGREVGAFSPEWLQEYPDVIQEGDVLKISLYCPGREALAAAVITIGKTMGYRVVDGKISLPELGSVQVANSTLDTVAKELQKKYRSDVGSVDVFVEYQTRNVQKVEIAGLVSTSIPVNGKIRLFDVCSKAGIPSHANLFKSYVLREGKILAIDLHKLLVEGDMKYNIVMRGNDKIYIADRSSASLMIMGEVRSQMVLPLPSGKISLREALASAGGIPYTGDKSYIQIIRGNLITPKIYVVSWEHVIHLPNDSLLLMPGDIVYVASRPITEWNRFISQLLPTIAIFDMARGGDHVGIMVDGKAP